MPKLQKALGSAAVRDMLERASPDVKHPIKNWRAALRAETGQYGENLWPMMAQLAKGLPWQVTLPDGRLSAPVMPTPDVMLRAQMFLAEMQFGKAVPQTEIQKAEQEAADFEAVRSLSDEQLFAEAAKIIDAQRVNQLTPGTQDAEFVVLEDTEQVGARIFEAQSGEQDDV